MLDIGFSELVLFGVAALLILGPEKLPTAVRTAGRWYAKIRRMISNVQRDIEQELQLSEMREHMQQELARIKNIELTMQQQINQMHDDLAELNPKDSTAQTEPHTQPTATKTTYSLLSPTQRTQYQRAPMTQMATQPCHQTNSNAEPSTQSPISIQKTTLSTSE